MAKICILLPRHWFIAKGGAEFQAHVFADHLTRTTNHEVLYLTRHPPAEGNSLSYQVAGFGGAVPQRFGMAWDSYSLYLALRRFAPDVIIQRVACAYTGVAAFYCAMRKAKLVWHISSDRDANLNPQLPVSRFPAIVDTALFRYGVRRATAIVAQTHSQARDLKETYQRAATTIIPNFANVPAKTWEKSKKFTVLWIANLKPLKRPEIFIQIARDLSQYDIDFRLVGRKISNAWCESILRDISGEPNIKYLGELELDQVNAELERSHLLVNTSTYEGLPNTFIQAWMREVPTVTLNIDPDGMIANARLGRCTPNIEILKGAILEYFRDRNELTNVGSNARAYAKRRFSMENANILRDLVGTLVEGDLQDSDSSRRQM